MLRVFGAIVREESSHSAGLSHLDPTRAPAAESCCQKGLTHQGVSLLHLDLGGAGEGGGAKVGVGAIVKHARSAATNWTLCTARKSKPWEGKEISSNREHHCAPDRSLCHLDPRRLSSLRGSGEIEHGKLLEDMVNSQ